jgi:CRISPR-associated protein Cmr2
LPADWDLLTIAFLHDPPDKALDIRGHERRAARYLQAALGRPADVFLIKQDAGLADRLAAMAERLPMPTAGPAGERAVSASDRRLRIHHPLGGGSREIIVPDLDEAKVEAEIKNIVAGIDPMQSRHLALWRLLPERLAVLDPAYADLPADTRVPDHTIWHHADTAAALTAADTGAGAAFLSFALAPVQTFIAAARSLRDLWSGSLILSWVTFRALLPIVEEAGPSALVFPYLRGNPMLDRWLRSQPGLADKIPNPSEEACGTPSLPNRFLALVPAGPDAGDALALARRCEEAARDAWRELAEKVRHRIARYVQDFAGWDALWQTQIDEFWEIRCAVLPYRAIPDDRLAAFNGANSFAEAWPEAQRIRALGQRIPESERPGYAQDSAGRWQATVDLAARALEARRSIRHVPRNRIELRRVPQKCALLGTVERMGPAAFDENRKFWEALSGADSLGAPLRTRENFSAVALTKRLALSAHLATELGVERHRRFPDTATVATLPWLEIAELADAIGEDWNGQWLHWRRPDEDQDEPAVPPALWDRITSARKKHGWPPAYLAVLTLDGDQMGQWLRGDKNPTLNQAIHPDLVKYFARIGAADHLRAKRPVGPALHAAISEALTNFAMRITPAIVNRHKGELIYAGGDDVLALVPTETAIACAEEIQRAFRGIHGDGTPGYFFENGHGRLVMGPCATLSAGIAVVHHKEDLRVALEFAREAEREAKLRGRNQLHLFIARRSGERSGASLNWAECTAMNRAVRAFRGGASDRWLYRLRAALPALPKEALDAELRRQLGRAEEDTRTALQPLVDDGVFRADGRPPNDTVMLWQAASFLARGREEGVGE